MEYRYYNVVVTFTSLFNHAKSTQLCDAGCGFDDLFSGIDLSKINLENTVSTLFSDNLLTSLLPFSSQILNWIYLRCKKKEHYSREI
ncbi:unnamed protein product [Brugia pahangi]|uniref:Pentapeptide repeat-containing protein n=1 Tax=Brugia pahangi TaxID=6280 RepID=A0A0N4TYY0_BRUPA|nr:unnamed protein product [Brugia pahangi]